MRPHLIINAPTLGSRATVELEVSSGDEGGGSVVIDVSRLCKGATVYVGVGELTEARLDLLPAELAARFPVDNATMEQLGTLVDAWRATHAPTEVTP
jgi:hypothetical protein